MPRPQSEHNHRHLARFLLPFPNQIAELRLIARVRSLTQNTVCINLIHFLELNFLYLNFRSRLQNPSCHFHCIVIASCWIDCDSDMDQCRFSSPPEPKSSFSCSLVILAFQILHFRLTSHTFIESEEKTRTYLCTMEREKEVKSDFLIWKSASTCPSLRAWSAQSYLQLRAIYSKALCNSLRFRVSNPCNYNRHHNRPSSAIYAINRQSSLRETSHHM